MMDSFITPSLHYSVTPFLHSFAPSRIYPLLGLLGGYLLVMLANPVRLALRDGFRCIVRYERISLTLFFNSLPLVQSRGPSKSISRKSFLLLTGIGYRFRTSGAKSRSRRLKVWPAFSIMLLPLIRSLLSPPSSFSLTGADCIAPSGAPYSNFTVGGAFRSISFSSSV